MVNLTNAELVVDALCIAQLDVVDLRFGTYVAGIAADSIGYILAKDAGGTERRLMVQA